MPLAVLLIPPPITAVKPVATFPNPPLTDAAELQQGGGEAAGVPGPATFDAPPDTDAPMSVAWLSWPPLTLERLPLAIFPPPPLTADATPLAMFRLPAITAA